MSMGERTEMRTPRSADPIWWLVTGVLSAGTPALPRLLGMQADRTTGYTVTLLALFFLGALVGALRRDRVWRWGVAAFLGFLVVDLLTLPQSEQYQALSYVQVLSGIAALMPGHLLQAVPVLAGAYLGCSLTKAGLA